MEEREYQKKIETNRLLMKSAFAKEGFKSDQQKQIKQPPLTKLPVGENKIELKKDFLATIKESNILTIINDRKSNRVFKEEGITLDQLSFLLWCTQGVKGIRGNNYATVRTVPSGGARHALETYLAVINVDNLEKGIYHYLPLEHALELIVTLDNIEDFVVNSLDGQKWTEKSSVVFYYTAIPYRSEWRYTLDAHKLVLIDAGHAVQNLYLGCGAISCGTCAVADYNQELADKLLKLDGKDEFVIYAAPVGVI
ncbi:MAG: SagB/ThcOx family dehydrogenase [Tissierellia bacterium]|nr:SagB/ThcOx family dehydrogenase [Tissierellia bacterium]